MASSCSDKAPPSTEKNGGASHLYSQWWQKPTQTYSSSCESSSSKVATAGREKGTEAAGQTSLRRRQASCKVPRELLDQVASKRSSDTVVRRNSRRRRSMASHTRCHHLGGRRGTELPPEARTAMVFWIPLSARLQDGKIAESSVTSSNFLNRPGCQTTSPTPTKRVPSWAGADGKRHAEKRSRHETPECTLPSSTAPVSSALRHGLTLDTKAVERNRKHAWGLNR